MGMSTDGQLCVRPMPTAGCAMSKVMMKTWLLFCSGINNMAFVLFWHQQHGFCVVSTSTTCFFCSGINNMAFVFFQGQQTWLLFSSNINNMAVKTDNSW